MNTKRILVINPNSNEIVTEGLVDTLAPFEIPDKLRITCKTLQQGPFGIETDVHIQQVIEPLQQTIREESEYDAYIIACYSDPGLAECRSITTKPVLGMQLSALSIAQSSGQKFGVLAIQEASIQRHMVYIKKLGLLPNLAGERPLNISVDEAATSEFVFQKLKSSGQLLIEEDGAGLIILGCAGLARHRQALESTLGVTVIDPTQAAVSIAMGCVLP